MQRQPPHLVAAGGLAEQAVQRVITAELIIAVGQHQDRGQPGNPPGQVPQRIQRRFVGPVNVLDDQDRRMLGPVQLGAQRREYPVPVAAVQHRPAEL